ncbi:MAG TPA: hypothetical protein VMS11_11325 [Solirubrobacterales bacterium]|nr:hypothetical protein [Solirubrobacterales bacterium]
MEKLDKSLVFTSSIVVAPAEDIAGMWVGHCLNFDVISQGSNPNEAFEAVIEAVAMAVLDDLDAGLDPRERPSAPAEDWALLVDAMKHGQKVRLSDVKADSRNVVLATQATFVFEHPMQDHDGFKPFTMPSDTALINQQAAA